MIRLTKSSKDSEVQLRYIVMPEHANPHGRVFGGKIIAWLDMSAAMVAERHSNMPVATICMDSIQFLTPISIGNHVSIHAALTYVGTSSMEIEVSAHVEDPYKKTRILATTAYLTFVGVNQDGKPSIVPNLLLKTKEEKLKNEQAKLRQQNRIKNK